LPRGSASAPGPGAGSHGSTDRGAAFAAPAAGTFRRERGRTLVARGGRGTRRGASAAAVRRAGGRAALLRVPHLPACVPAGPRARSGPDEHRSRLPLLTRAGRLALARAFPPRVGLARPATVLLAQRSGPRAGDFAGRAAGVHAAHPVRGRAREPEDLAAQDPAETRRVAGAEGPSRRAACRDRWPGDHRRRASRLPFPFVEDAVSVDFEQLRDRASPWMSPIPGVIPDAASARLEAPYQTVTNEVGKLDRPDGGTVDWKRVAELSEDLLRTRTKDLLIGSYLAHALHRLRGLDGLATGATLLAEMLDRFWDSLQPEARRLRGRVNALQWFLDKTLLTLPEQDFAPAELPGIEALQAAFLRLAELARARFADAAPAMSPLLERIERMRV